MNKNILLAIIFCLSFFCLSLFSVEGFDWKNLRYSGNAITTDEMAHIPSGYYYLKTGRYFLNPEHPPLIKDLSALPLLLLNPIFPDIKSNTNIDEHFAWYQYPPKEFIFSKNLEIKNAQWDWAGVFLFNPQSNPDLIAFFARSSVIFFNALLLFLLYRLLSVAWNEKVALIGIFLVAFSQFSIAHSSLVTTDFMSSILQLLSIISFSIYIKSFIEKKKTTLFFTITILFLSMSLLSKFSSIILGPSLFVGGLIYIAFTKKKWAVICDYFLRFSIISLLTLLVISIYYYFHTLNMNNDDMVAQLNFFYPNGLPLGIGNMLEFFIYSNPILKGLAQYINGILMVLSRMSVAYQKIFFMGKVYGSEGAGALYFPALYFTKLTVGMLVLNLFAISYTFYKLLKNKEILSKKILVFLENPLSFFILFFIYSFAFITLTSTLQIGLRHIFPIILGVTLLTAKKVYSAWELKILKIKFKYIFYIIFATIILSVFFSFPNYISFYNIFAGGTDNGYKIATDSNFDWGQDTKKIVSFVETNNINKIYVDIDVEAFVPLRWYLKDAYETIDLKKDILPESGSYLALSISKYETYKNRYAFLENNLIQKIGETILVFQIP